MPDLELIDRLVATYRILNHTVRLKPEAELAQGLESALGRIEGEDAMTPEAKAQIVAQLRAKIAELRAGK